MVNGVMNNSISSKITINQLLHGYDEGHRLLGGSIKPEGKDAKTLMAMTDLAGYGETWGPDGYLTGYPLSEMGVYALTRTWMASEMPRPGCVWSHTLLIDFSDLASICNTKFLKLFNRPEGGTSKASYSKPLKVDDDYDWDKDASLPARALAALVYAVYSFPEDNILIRSCDDMPIEQMVLSMWLQQWPRLRRGFRFCTCAFPSRSSVAEGFDVQFIQPNGNYSYISRIDKKFRCFDLNDFKQNLDEKWIDKVVDDIAFNECNSSFREFLGKYGAETNMGRAAFMPLTIIWESIYGGNEVDFKEAIKSLSKIKPTINSLMKRIVDLVIDNIDNYKKPEKFIVDFLFDNFEVLGSSYITANANDLARIIWDNSPKLIWSLFQSNSKVKRSLAEVATKWMSPEEVLQGVGRNPDLLCEVIRVNPDLAASSLVWDSPDPIPKKVTYLLLDSNMLDEKILNGMLGAKADTVPSLGLMLFGQRAVDAAVKIYDDGNKWERGIAKNWLAEARNQPEFLLNTISKCEIRNIDTLAYISSLVDYSASDASSSKDAWAIAIDSLDMELSEKDLDLCVFLLARALSGKSNCPEILIVKAFGAVHSALLDSRVPANSWSMIEEWLPWVSFFSRWDKANRLRLGVVEKFINEKLPAEAFLNITDDLNVFIELVDIAMRISKGRKYLKKGLSEINSCQDHGASNKYKIIEKFFLNDI